MTETRMMDAEEAQEHVYDAVAMQAVSRHRWYEKRLVVFREDDGSCWGFYYLMPHTEEQEGQDRFESDPVEVFPVTTREVTTTVYERAS